MIKSISLLTRKRDLTHEEFLRHWVEVHAPLAHGVPGLLRYVQRAAESEEMKRLHADGALFIGSIKTFTVEEKQILP
jgi:hypothetical protein